MASHAVSRSADGDAAWADRRYVIGCRGSWYHGRERPPCAAADAPDRRYGDRIGDPYWLLDVVGQNLFAWRGHFDARDTQSSGTRP